MSDDSVALKAVEFKTMVQDSPEALDRMINEYLSRRVERADAVYRWVPYGTVTVLVSPSGFTKTFIQSLVLVYHHWLERKEPPTTTSFGQDPIMSFINS